MPRTFELVRHRDPSGVSGIGVVAEGCVFTDGSVALRWRGSNPATAVWPDLKSVLAVHGHQGATIIHWLEREDHHDLSEQAPESDAHQGSEPHRPDWRSQLEGLSGLDGTHPVRPPSSTTDPSPAPRLRPRGWAGARHLR